MDTIHVQIRQFWQSLLFALVSVIALSTLFVSLPTHSLAQTWDATSEDEGGHEGHEEGGDEEGDGIPDDMQDWESPYSSPTSLMTTLEAAEESGTCFDYMNAKYDLLLDETQYWSAVAAPGSEGEHFISVIRGYLFDLRLAMSNHRLDLEKYDGSTATCEDNSKLSALSDPLEMLKLKTRRAGWLIDSGDSRELTADIVDKRCEFAGHTVEKLGERIQHLTEKLNERVDSGKFNDLSNVKELLTMAQEHYATASSLLDEADTLDDIEAQMRACSGAREESSVGLQIFSSASSYHTGKKTDGSSATEEMDAKIKLFLGFIAQKRLDVLARPSADRVAILAELETAQQQIIAIQIDFAKVKYDANPDLSVFDQQLEDIKDQLKTVISVLDDTEAGIVTKQQRQQSAKKLGRTARQELKELRKDLKAADDNANTAAEKEVVKFIEQTTLPDAITARDAARAYRGDKEYKNAQLQALMAIEALHAGEDTLAEAVK